MWVDEKRTPKRVLEWKPIGRRIGVDFQGSKYVISVVNP